MIRKTKVKVGQREQNITSDTDSFPSEKESMMSSSADLVLCMVT